MYLPVVTACCTLPDTQLAYLHIPCVHISLPQKCFYDPLHISLSLKSGTRKEVQQYVSDWPLYDWLTAQLVCGLSFARRHHLEQVHPLARRHYAMSIFTHAIIVEMSNLLYLSTLQAVSIVNAQPSIPIQCGDGQHITVYSYHDSVVIDNMR